MTFTAVTYGGKIGSISSFTFQAPTSDTELNLISVSPAPGELPSGITKIAPGGVRLEDGDIIFSFAGVDIPDPFAFDPSFTSTGITDSGVIGRELLQSETTASARATLGATTTGSAVVTAASAAAARTAINANLYVNALDFGVVGDGSVDDTTNMQAWLTYLVTNHRKGWLPNGTYKITSTLVAPSGYGWGIHGENEAYTIIKQHGNDMPILQLGSTVFSQLISLENLLLIYNTVQPSTATNANCIVFHGGAGTGTADLNTTYFSSFKHLTFSKGYYAMTVASGMFPPWGSEFDMLTMVAMSGGFYDNTVSASSGIPNNHWGRMTLYCDTSVGPIFKNIRGYNMVIDNIEFLKALLGPQLITTQSGFTAEIGSVKLEWATYTGAGTSLFAFSNPCHVRIGSVHVGGVTAVFTPSSGIQYIVRDVGSGDPGDSDIEIGSIRADATSLSGACHAIGTGVAKVRIRNVDMTGGWTLQSTGSTVSGNLITVHDWANGLLSGDKGDADYTVALGDPNVVHFDTAFTAQRTITLPASAGNDLSAGLYYDLIFDGAINGANTAIIKRGSTTMRTQTVDKKRLRYQWRRGASNGEWVLIDVSDIGTVTTIGDSLLTAVDASAARTAIGAGTGTSDLAIGTTSTTAKVGDYQPTSTNISDSTAVGRSVLVAVDAPAARTAIGAGTSDLAIGTTSTTAKVGDYQPASTNISDSTATGRSLLTAADASAARTTLAAAKNTVVELFTSSGTWTKPTGAVAVRVRCVGPGGSGGAGALGASPTNALSGGGGGSSGGTSEMVFDAADLTATVTVTIGAGGAASSGQTSSSTAGANGSAGTPATSFGTYLSGGRGAGGTGGGVGTAGAGGTISTSGFGYGMQTGVAGGAGSALGAAGAAGGSGGSAGGGGGGGGINAAGTVATAGGGGGISFSGGLTGGSAGSAAVGGDGVASGIRGPGTGGGGGGAGLAAGGNGYNGGTGGVYGAGGGGGGAALNTYTSGGGGAGGAGVCIVTTYF